MIPRRESLGGAEEPCLADVCPAADADDPHARARPALLAEIEDDLRDTASSTDSDRFDAVVLAALASGRALPIGHGQTIPSRSSSR